MSQWKAEGHVAVGQFHIVCQSVEDMRSILVADLYAVYTIGQ